MVKLHCNAAATARNLHYSDHTTSSGCRRRVAWMPRCTQCLIVIGNATLQSCLDSDPIQCRAFGPALDSDPIQCSPSPPDWAANFKHPVHCVHLGPRAWRPAAEGRRARAYPSASWALAAAELLVCKSYLHDEPQVRGADGLCSWTYARTGTVCVSL